VVSNLLALTGMVIGLLIGPLTFLHARAEPTRAQYCLTEGWHFEGETIRNLVIAQCMGRHP